MDHIRQSWRQDRDRFTDVEGSAGFRFAFKLTGEEAYQLTITPQNGGTPLTFEGMLAKAGKRRNQQDSVPHVRKRKRRWP
jgi:hypothetical protein